MASENLIKVIKYCAQQNGLKGLRPNNIYLKDEYENINWLQKNVESASLFLTKGIKEVPAIGGKNYVDVYDLFDRPDKKKLKEIRD